MADQLPAGSVIGILGGGQLGRMLSVAAARLGYRSHIYEPGADAPAAQVADRLTRAPYDDETALRAFAAGVDVITYEFENIPTAALDVLEKLRPIHPGRQALAVSQDRLAEKHFLQTSGLTVAPFAEVNSVDDLVAAMAKIGTPSILKTRRFGYDGKGQVRLTADSDPAKAMAALADAPAVLEGFVDFEREISVIGARAADGQVSCFDPGENVHQNGILHTTNVPAQISGSQRMDAVLIASKILTTLDYVGVMGVELFVTKSGLIINEIAPRVHNSGHWTQQGCAVDQFEQHIRAIAGWPLGDGQRLADVEMLNLIGEDVEKLPDLAIATHTSIHLYGKAEVRKGRKMGHVNRITSVR